ncbi:TPA: DUF3601 domain-containing protein [Vibrio cholerae]
MDRDYLQSEYGVLKAGQCYKVVRSFKDYRNINYERGDVMRFLGSNFVPYESGLSLFFDKNGSERQIMLCVRPEFQMEIAHHLDSYFCKLDDN